MMLNAKLIFLFCVVYFINTCAAKSSVKIDPKNPNDPSTLPAGTTKNVLIVGKSFKNGCFLI